MPSFLFKCARVSLVTRLADEGSIVDFDASAGKHLVKYDVDGEQRWHCLDEDEEGGQLRWLPNGSSRKRSLGEHKSPTATLMSSTPRGKTTRASPRAVPKQPRGPARPSKV